MKKKERKKERMKKKEKEETYIKKELSFLILLWCSTK
jgi:hypothetical protein